VEEEQVPRNAFVEIIGLLCIGNIEGDKGGVEPDGEEDPIKSM